MIRMAMVPVLLFGGVAAIGLAAFGGGLLIGKWLDRHGRGLFGKMPGGRNYRR